MTFIVKYRKLLIITGGIIAIGLSIWFGINYSARSATVVVEYTPLSSSVKLNNSRGSSHNRVRPGEYQVVISRDGFSSHEEKVTVDEGELVTIYAVLESNRDDTANWYNDNPKDAQKREQILDALYTQQNKDIRANFPIGEILPYIPPRGGYRIDYGAGSNPNAQAVYITFYTEVGKKLAQEFIANEGFNLEDYEVIYKQESFEVPSPAHG